jgi:DNA-directed RNA polymerase subunit RPC12/RpoP
MILTDAQKRLTHCKDCGNKVVGIHIRNDIQGYVKCLKCGLGVERSKNQP